MNKFPLYTTLYKDTTTKDLKVSEKKNFIKCLSQVEDDASELIYVLIKIYYMEENPDGENTWTPYGSKFVKNNIEFDINLLPNRLKQIINKFLTFHLQKIQEDRLQEDRSNGININMSYSYDSYE